MRTVPLQHHCRVLNATEVVIDRWECSLYDPFWRFYRNRDDGAVIITGQGEHPMRAGECLLVPAWSRFTTRCSGTVRHTFVHFDPVGLPSAWVREHCTRLVPLPRRKEWDTVLDTLPVRDPDAWAQHLRCQAMLCEALAMGIAAAGKEVVAGGEERRAGVSVVEPALRWIDTHLRDPLPVDLLARRCGIGRDHFTRAFTRAIGTSPARHVAERRITAAALRLLNSDDGIEVIAEEVGFANRYHFSRVFQRILRTSPAVYRRQGRMG